jgi:hypothetical protein
MAILKNTIVSDTGHIQLPSGSTAQRPASPINGLLRYNTNSQELENYENNWKKIIKGNVGDWAYKEGPISFNSAYRVNWNTGEHIGTSMDATTYGFGILINETGRYIGRGWQRVGTENFAGLSLNGDRAALDSRNDLMWSHDHAGESENWAQSVLLGYLEAGWIISFGPPANYGQYTVNGYSGGMWITRLN